MTDRILEGSHDYRLIPRAPVGATPRPRRARKENEVSETRANRLASVRNTIC